MERVDLVDLPLHLLALCIQLPHIQGLPEFRVVQLLGFRVSDLGIENQDFMDCTHRYTLAVFDGKRDDLVDLPVHLLALRIQL